MSSPSSAPVQSTKRPLEEPSSPSGATDQPDAKRPALDKLDGDKNPDVEDIKEVSDAVAKTELQATPAVDDTTVLVEQKVTQGEDTSENVAENDAFKPQPATSMNHDESAWIHVRCVISSAEAATVIGKGGENVTTIRKLSGAKCTVSDYQKGAVERVLTVSGAVDAIAKAFGLIIRTLNNEEMEQPSNAQSRTYPLRLLIPHILIGSIIGKGGVRIREIQETSGARLNASDSCLPMSTERTLVILGVADAVHIAAYYVGTTLFEQLTERFGGPAASAYATRSGGPAGVIPGGMQVVPYSPQSAGGSYGHPNNFRRHEPRNQPTPGHAYAQPYAQPQQNQPAQSMHYGGTPAYGAGPQQPHQAGPHVPTSSHAGPPAQPVQGLVPGQPLTQQIYIPNDMVGAIIGKGGAKINEIRQLSGSVIKINEPQDNSNERLVTITGTGECNQMALYMLYSRLGMYSPTMAIII